MRKDAIISNQNYKGINPVLFGCQKCPPGHSFGPAVRNWFLIHYIVSGTGIFRTETQEYRLHAGEMFVILPGQETYYEADSLSPWHYIWIGFTADTPLPVHLSPVIHAPAAGVIFQKMLDCATHEKGRSAFLCARLWELFTLLLENSVGGEIDYVQYALDCIHSEYVEPITVETIASRLGLNRSYFSTLFKLRVGVSPKRYLFEYRMHMAASLLREERKPVTVTANSVGYTDIFNFSKMFKQYYGVSPLEYAKHGTKPE